MNQITETVRQFIVENFLFGNDSELADNTSFMDEGIIDSTGVLELVTFIEETFLISIEDNELITENLDSIQNVVTFIMRKTQKTEAA